MRNFLYRVWQVIVSLRHPRQDTTIFRSRKHKNEKPVKKSSVFDRPPGNIFVIDLDPTDVVSVEKNQDTDTWDNEGGNGSNRHTGDDGLRFSDGTPIFKGDYT